MEQHGTQNQGAVAILQTPTPTNNRTFSYELQRVRPIPLVFKQPAEDKNATELRRGYRHAKTAHLGSTSART